MAKISAPEKVRWVITPKWPILCFALFLLALIVQNSDAVDRFLVRRYIYDTPKTKAPSAQSTPLHAHRNSTLTRTTSARLDVEIEDSPIVPSPGVQKLLDPLREATVRASGGEEVEFSESERRAWEERHPCRSRSEIRLLYAERRRMKDVPVNRQWGLVFGAYEKLHRTCIRRVGDLQGYFLSKNSSVDCKFVVAEPHFGLGNKLFHTLSVFLYAVLTQRVILLPESTSIPAVMCEPFSGSSWGIKEELYKLIKENRNTSAEFWKGVDDDNAGEKHSLGSTGLFASSMNDEWVGPEPRFWCDTEQKYMESVPWLTISGCTLFVHKLFAIEGFRHSLEDLFPNRVVVTHILRSLLLPGDLTWERILHVDEVYLQGAEKQVGIQIRYFEKDEEYKKKNDLINKRVTQCLWENKMLPEVCPGSSKEKDWEKRKFAPCKVKMTAKDHEDPHVIKVVVGSLFLGLHDHLNDLYLRHDATTTKEAVGVVQLSHELTQEDGAEVDSQALVEVITLSLSDVVLITPMSTFGGVIQGYGGLIPWYIEFGPEENSTGVCEKGKGIEPCYMGASQQYKCPFDAVGEKKIAEVVPYLQDCLPIDIGYGYKLNMIPKGYGMQMVPEQISDHDFAIG